MALIGTTADVEKKLLKVMAINCKCHILILEYMSHIQT